MRNSPCSNTSSFDQWVIGGGRVVVSRRASLGFTLVEVIATLVIIAILGAIAVPRLFDNQAFSERGYIDEVASALRYAQKIALASGCEVSVVVGVGGYTATQRNTLNNCDAQTGPWTTPVRRADGNNLAGTAPVGVAMAPAATLIFNRDGVVTNGNPPTFAVGIFTLTVDPVSGLVTVLP